MSAVAMVLATERRNIATNTATVTYMVEAATTCQRNVFSEMKIAIKCIIKIMYSV